VAAARSRQGASFALVSSIPCAEFQPCLSVGLYAEWHDVLTRPENIPAGLCTEDVVAFLRFLASQSHLQEIHFLWRPFLPDPDDDLVLELALAANCEYIITHNVADFRGSQQLGVQVITPRNFLKLLGARP
jgi:predicted nucleic acid-binding protein